MIEIRFMRRVACAAALLAALALPSAARAQEKTLEEIAALPRHEQRAALEAYTIKHPESVDATFRLGNWLYEENHLEEALVNYRKILAADPLNFRVLVNASLALEGLERPEESIELFTAYLKQRPDDAKANAFYGETLWQVGRKSEGMEAFRKSIALDARCAEAHLSLGNAFAELGILREAIREWNMVIAASSSEDLVKLAKQNIARAEGGL